MVLFLKGERRVTALLSFILCIQILAGCGQSADSEVQGSYYVITGMESTPVINYKLSEQSANVLVSRLGYQIGSRKEAAVKGKELPEAFRVVREADGEVVYAGEIERISYNSELELYTGYASFDQLETAGVYYLECDLVGRSYSFCIEEQLYRELFYQVYQELTDKCADGSLSLSGAIALLTAYDWYIDLFPDEDRDGVPDVLAALAGWMENYEQQALDEDQLLRSAFLAKFSYLYQNYNRRYATSCLQRATTLFGNAQNTIQKDAEHFFALTELYRATGLYTYKVQIEDYASFLGNNGSYFDEQEYLYGAMTYLMTRQKVNMDFCDSLMKKLMTRAEEIAGYYSEIVHPIAARNNGTEDMLQHVRELLFANYVLDSYQYYNIDKDFMAYLGGRNLKSVNFFETEDNREGYILLLAQLSAQAPIQE